MKVKINGGKEDLIKRCADCDYCVFEHILFENQRKIKVLDLPLPKNHIHRSIIEQVCGRNYDNVCPMKYAAMRSGLEDFMAAQFGGAVKDFMWDLGKKYNRKVEYDEALPEWTKDQDLGRGKQESYAERFRDIWNLGLREIKEGKKKNKITRQNLTASMIYEIVIANPKNYETAFNLLKKLKDESKKREI